MHATGPQEIGRTISVVKSEEVTANNDGELVPALDVIVGSLT
jgi:hypothetical protein